MKTSSRISIAFGFLTLVLIAVVGIYHYSITSAVRQFESLLNLDVQLADRADNVLIYLFEAEREEERFLRTRAESVEQTFHEELVTVKSELQVILDLTESNNLKKENTNASSVLGYVEEYEKSSEQLFEAWRRRGLDHNSGLEGALRTVAHDFMKAMEKHEVDNLFQAYMTMRLKERKYFLGATDTNRRQYLESIDAYDLVLGASKCDAKSKLKQQEGLTDYRNLLEPVLQRDEDATTALQAAADRIESALKEAYVPELINMMLEVRRREKDYLLRLDKSYVEDVHGTLAEIENAFYRPGVAAEHQENVVEFVNAYKTAFDALVDEYSNIDSISLSISQVISRIHPLILEISEAAQQRSEDHAAEISTLSADRARLALLAGVLGSIVSIAVGLFFMNSIRGMEGRQDELDAVATDEMWLKNGSTELYGVLRGEQDGLDLAKSVVAFLAKYLDAQMASLYIFDKHSESLILRGSYAFNMRKRVNEKIKLGEGIAGQAAMEKELISVTGVPQGYLHITSSLGDAVPSTVLAVPYLSDDQVIGVVEFAKLGKFSELEIRFISSVMESIAIAFIAADSRERLADLLTASQEQSEQLQTKTEEMETQQEELRAANEELEERGEELRASNEELEEKTEALELQKTEIEGRTAEVEKAKLDVEEKARELEQASKYKSEFLANMSHELRTPLNSLLILSEMLAGNDEGNLTEDQVESAQVIHSGGQNLLFLINEILDLSKVEAGMLEVHHEEVKLDDIISDIERQFRASAEDKGLDFAITIDPDVPASISTDGQRLDQILRNFLSNAFKFTEDGSVTLNIGRAKEDVVFTRDDLTHESSLAFSVQDTGLGIPEDKQRAVFEAFQQADGSTSRNYGGTGLGLSISQALANLLNGEIQLESEMGAGSTFTLFLPLERRTDRPDRSVDPNVKQEQPQRRAVRPERPKASTALAPEYLPDDRKDLNEGDRSVLIIEDDEQFARILMRQARKKGFKCLAAGDGGSGLRLASDYKPSAIILDLGLPDIDGATVLDGLKYDLSTRHIPVHVISAQDKTVDIMRKGAMGYMTKPLDAADIDTALCEIEGFVEGNMRKVLVVEDDANSLKAVQALLASEGVEISGTGSGGEARRMITEDKFDCIILNSRT